MGLDGGDERVRALRQAVTTHFGLLDGSICNEGLLLEYATILEGVVTRLRNSLASLVLFHVAQPPCRGDLDADRAALLRENL